MFNNLKLIFLNGSLAARMVHDGNIARATRGGHYYYYIEFYTALRIKLIAFAVLFNLEYICDVYIYFK